jgi:hypothetical protein
VLFAEIARRPNEVQATTPQTSEVSAHDVEFDVMLGSPRSVTFSPGASLVWPAPQRGNKKIGSNPHSGGEGCQIGRCR